MTVPAGIPQRFFARRRRPALLAGLLSLVLTSAVLISCAPEPEAAAPHETPTHASTPIATASPSPTPLPTDEVTPEPSPTVAGPASVTIVNYGVDDQGVHASGLVTGDAGASGTCVLTATSPSGESLSAELEATPTPAAMNCGLIEIPVPAGEWTLVLSYRSASGMAESAPTKVTRP